MPASGCSRVEGVNLDGVAVIVFCLDALVQKERAVVSCPTAEYAKRRDSEARMAVQQPDIVLDPAARAPRRRRRRRGAGASAAEPTQKPAQPFHRRTS